MVRTRARPRATVEGDALREHAASNSRSDSFIANAASPNKDRRNRTLLASVSKPLARRPF
jgi:hypothetical protein